MAGGAAVSTAARPVLKGLHNASIKRNLTVAIVASFIGMFAYKFAVNDPRKQQYADYYKDYDAEAAFQRMRKRGVFVSAPADD